MIAEKADEIKNNLNTLLENVDANDKKIETLAQKCVDNSNIDPELYVKYDVKRGLRDLNGKGVLTGLTEIGDVKAYETVDGKNVPCKGHLYYRGYDVEDIVKGFLKDKRYGFEETTYLLLFGELPNKQELDDFCEILGTYRTLPASFVRDVIMKSPSPNVMNSLARCVLMLYSYDPDPDNISVPNVLKQSLKLIAQLPLLSVHSYWAYNYYHEKQSFIVHHPDPKLSTAENILYVLRPDQKYTELEARILDMALVLHAEHGGGNNSTFTTHVVTSTGTDTYSAVASSLCSLKGPRHGGANIKVMEMFDDMKEHVHDWKDDEEISAYLQALLNKEAFDHAGLIYGIGHAVYSLSDPRAEIFKEFVEKLAVEKHCEDEFGLYSAVERLAPEVISGKRKMYKGVSANVDFYSGFVYNMLGLPRELYTPLFAVSRISGWSAHRLEELANPGKIIRPAYKNVHEHVEYVPLEER